MELDAEFIRTLVVGASGGIPTTVLLIHIVRGLSLSLADLKEKIEGFSSRLQKLEVSFDVLFQNELKRLQSSHTQLESRIRALETVDKRLQ